MAKKSKQIADLFLAFLKIGAFTFGGGYAMVPLIHREAVDKYHWITDEDMLDIIAIAESTPGVIAVNSATFIGYRVCGFWGAAVATFGVVLPAFTVIMLLSAPLDKFKSLEWVEYAFRGIRAAVVVLMLSAVLKLIKYCPKQAFTFIVVGAAFILTALLGVNTIYVLIGAAVCGLLYQLFLAGLNKDRGKGK